MAEKAGEADGMEAARARFEQWRSDRSGKAPIPDELWKLAINAARQQGVNRAAQQLHLDAGKLKRLLVGADPWRSKTRRRPRFVELIAPALTDEEIARLLTAFDRGTVAGRRDYAITRCLLDLGLRSREVARLRLEDVD
jgi:integrase